MTTKEKSIQVLTEFRIQLEELATHCDVMFSIVPTTNKSVYNTELKQHELSTRRQTIQIKYMNRVIERISVQDSRIRVEGIKKIIENMIKYEKDFYDQMISKMDIEESSTKDYNLKKFYEKQHIQLIDDDSQIQWILQLAKDMVDNVGN